MSQRTQPKSSPDDKPAERRYPGPPRLPHTSEEREKTSLALPRTLMDRARHHGTSTLGSTLQDAAEVYLLHALPTPIRDRIEAQVAEDGRPWKQVMLDAIIEGFEQMAHKAKAKGK